MMVNNEIGVKQPIHEIGDSLDDEVIVFIYFHYIINCILIFKENYVSRKEYFSIPMQLRQLEKFLLTLMK